MMVIPLMSDLQPGFRQTQCSIFHPDLYQKSAKDKTDTYGENEERMSVNYKNVFSELEIKWRRKKGSSKKEDSKHKEDLKILRSTATEVW